MSDKSGWGGGCTRMLMRAPATFRPVFMRPLPCANRVLTISYRIRARYFTTGATLIRHDCRALSCVLVLAASPFALAQSTEPTQQDLAEQIRVLQAKVQQLESNQQKLNPAAVDD